ncbi:MAG: hypothetical protein H0U27_06960 [Nitrosopumilus sp.]|nr:hypothetical protein [Nitrosopumilus sp.]
MYDIAKYDERGLESLVSQCKVDRINNSFVFQGPPVVLLATLLDLSEFSKFLHDAALLKIFDAIHNGIKTASALAKFARCYPVDESDLTDYLCEICDKFNTEEALFYLVRYGFLTCNSKSEYELTELGQYLCITHPDTLQPTLAMLNHEWWQAVDQLEVTLINEEPSFTVLNEKSFFDYLQSEGIKQAKFNTGMTCLYQNQDRIMVNYLKQYFDDFKSYTHIANIAGGVGGLLREIEAQCEGKHLTLYEQPKVIEELQSKAETEIHSMQLIKGNFLKPYIKNHLPDNQDLYLIKGVLHNFSDDECLKILSHIREVMPQTSQLCVIEHTLPSSDQPHISFYLDLLMMMLQTGHERYSNGWLKLFLLAGFTWVNRNNSTVVEDHTIMVCKPSLAEISRGIGFFNTANNIAQVNLSQKLVELIDKINIARNFRILEKNNIADSFFNQNKDYYVQCVNLLGEVIKANSDVTILSVITDQDLEKLSLNINDYSSNYLFQPINFILKENSITHWAGIIFDLQNNRIYYFDPVNGHLPNIIDSFLQAQNFLIGADFIHISLQETRIPKNQSGACVIAWFTAMIRMIELNDLASVTQQNIQKWFDSVHKKIFNMEMISPESLRTQQLRWTIDYLEEISKTEHIFSI